MSGSKNVLPGRGPRGAAARIPRLTPLAACLAVSLAAAQAAAASEPGGFAQAPLPPQLGASLPVTSCADDGSPGTLRSVVASAMTGDTVDMGKLACGTITLLTGQIEVHVDDLTIAGPGRDALTIDGDDNGRVFLHDGAGTLTLTGVTLTHGHADSAAANPTLALGASGGCVLSKSVTGRNGSIALINAAVTSCKTTVSAPGTGVSSAAGGGVFASNALSLSNSIVSDNSAVGVITGSNTGINATGGGAFARYGPITLSDSVVSGNSATTGDPSAVHRAFGGGISANLGNVSVTNSIVENNFAGCNTPSSLCSAALGGGIYTGNNSAFQSSTVSSSVISGNKVTGSVKTLGGGIYNNNNSASRSLAIDNTTISENTASSTTGQVKGGGVFTYQGSLAVSNSTISGNSAANGGGIFADYDALTVSQSTLSGNSAAKGGGIYLGHAGYYSFTHPMTVRNSTITANVATDSAGGAGVADTHTMYGASTFQSTIIAGNIATPGDKADLSASVNAIAGANNLVVAAQGVTLPADTISADPLLGPLRDNGGLTFTHALAPLSPAVDAGNNAAKLERDQRGDGFPRSFGLAPDIGAFERTITPSTCYRKLRPPC